MWPSIAIFFDSVVQNWKYLTDEQGNIGTELLKYCTRADEIMHSDTPTRQLRTPGWPFAQTLPNHVANHLVTIVGERPAVGRGKIHGITPENWESKYRVALQDQRVQEELLNFQCTVDDFYVNPTSLPIGGAQNGLYTRIARKKGEVIGYFYGFLCYIDLLTTELPEVYGLEDLYFDINQCYMDRLDISQIPNATRI